MDEKTEFFSSESASNFLKKNIPTVVLLIGGALMLIVGGLQFFSENKDSGIEFVPVESRIEASQIFVDISGAVNSPGIYEFSQGDRISNAIEKAGGLSEKANTGYISKNLNRAQLLSDGMKLYFPFEGEEVESVLGSSSNDLQGLININTASVTELDELPGIGPARAEDIISGRPYGDINDLLIKKILGASIFDQIKDLLTVQ